jgi:heterodisulfide reductase subunit C
VENHPRGPIPFIILSKTGEDVRDCMNCESCPKTFQHTDIAINEVMQAAARDDRDVFKNPILWNCESILESNLTCMVGINIPQVIYALREEAEIRGIIP